MQLRFDIALNAEDYVRCRAWEQAVLHSCPLHPEGGCGLARHGTYARSTPTGARIARWYCPKGHCTFSLLPDCFAARLPGTLVQLQAAVLIAEQSASLEAAANAVRRDDISLPSALRWLRRRIQRLHRSLQQLVVMLPVLCGCAPTLSALQHRLHADGRLLNMRALAAAGVSEVSAPVGFAAATVGSGPARVRFRSQHNQGPDPPALCA